MNPQPNFHGTKTIICKKLKSNKNNNDAKKQQETTNPNLIFDHELKKLVLT